MWGFKPKCWKQCCIFHEVFGKKVLAADKIRTLRYTYQSVGERAESLVNELGKLQTDCSISCLKGSLDASKSRGWSWQTDGWRPDEGCRCSILACERNALCCEKISRRAFGYSMRSPMLVFHTCLWTRLWEWAWTPTAERVTEGWGNNRTRFTSKGWVVSFMDKTKVTVSALQNLSVRPLFWSIWPWLIHSSPEIKIYPMTLKTGYNYVAYILVSNWSCGEKVKINWRKAVSGQKVWSWHMVTQNWARILSKGDFLRLC